MSAQITPRTLALILAAVIVVLGIGGWFGLVASQHSSATSLEHQAADAQAALDTLQASARQAAQEAAKAKHKTADKHEAAGKVSQAQQLEAAFPRTVQMPALLLQVERLAAASGVSLESFAPSGQTSLAGYDSVPISVSVVGRYRGIQRFVHGLRVQAGSVKGHVRASGRLFSVDTVNIAAAPDGLPALTATIMLDAFVYSGVMPAAATGTDDGDGSTDPAATTEGTP